MTMQRYSSTRDVTANVRAAMPSSPHFLLYLCGHKGLRFGGQMRGRVLMRCPTCAEAKRQSADCRPWARHCVGDGA